MFCLWFNIYPVQANMLFLTTCFPQCSHSAVISLICGKIFCELPEGGESWEDWKTRKGFSDHWEPTIYKPEWLIYLLEPGDAQTRSGHARPRKTKTHTQCPVWGMTALPAPQGEWWLECLRWSSGSLFKEKGKSISLIHSLVMPKCPQCVPTPLRGDLGAVDVPCVPGLTGSLPFQRGLLQCNVSTPILNFESILFMDFHRYANESHT